jgi:hypothetical protein
VTDDPLGPMRRFARAGTGGRRRANPFLCRHLRTKTWLAPDAFGEGDPGTSPSIAQYWCLRTMRSNGPDGDFVVPEECTDDRVCFEAIAATESDT